MAKKGLAAVLFCCLLAPARAQENYGAKGLYPIYETAGQWFIFDKNPEGRKKGDDSPLAPTKRFLVVGSQGAGIFEVARASAAYGGACRENKPARLRTALLRGPRRRVGSPVMGISVPESFSLEGSRALYTALENGVGEQTYHDLSQAIRESALADVRAGNFPFRVEEDTAAVAAAISPEKMIVKIDFGAKLSIQGLADAFFLVEGTQISATYRRCLRLADGARLIGGCVPMPHTLMAETAQLKFVSYDPSGQGQPYLLAYTPQAPLWGHERWGFVVRKEGPRIFLFDTMDVRCRAGF